MNILSLENVCKNYGIKPLFESVTLGLEDTRQDRNYRRERLGQNDAFAGHRRTRRSPTRDASCAQGEYARLSFAKSAVRRKPTVLETIFAASSGVMQTIRDYEAACHDLATDATNAKTLERVSDLQHELEITGGWEIETNARSVLTRLGITDTSAQNGNALRRTAKTRRARARTYLQTRHFDSRRADQSSRRRHDRVARRLSATLHGRASARHARPLFSRPRDGPHFRD